MVLLVSCHRFCDHPRVRGYNWWWRSQLSINPVLSKLVSHLMANLSRSLHGVSAERKWLLMAASCLFMVLGRPGSFNAPLNAWLESSRQSLRLPSNSWEPLWAGKTCSSKLLRNKKILVMFLFLLEQRCQLFSVRLRNHNQSTSKQLGSLKYVVRIYWQLQSFKRL